MSNHLQKNAIVVLNKARKAIERYMLEFEAGDLHEFRQEMKKLSAIRALWLAESGKEKVWKGWKHIKSFYRITSPVREADIRAGWLSAEGIVFVPDNRDKVREELGSGVEDWLSFSKAIKKRIRQSQFTIKNRRIVEYVAVNRLVAMDILIREEPGKEWHEARKMIKSGNFLEKLLPENKRNTHQDKWLDLGTLLGEWHDLEDLIAFLSLKDAEIFLERIEVLRQHKKQKENVIYLEAMNIGDV
jgi:hypothetical protein